jgi:type II secretion system protein N
MNPRLLKWIGYPVYTLVILIVMVYVTFPTGKVKAMLEDRVAASGNMELSIGSLSLSPLLSLSAENVVLRIRPKAGPPQRMRFSSGGRSTVPSPAVPPTGDKPQKPELQIISLNRVDLSLGLFALLGKTVDAEFEVAGFGGTIKGAFKSNMAEGWSLEADLASIRARRIPQLQTMGPPLRGSLSGKLALKVPRRGGWSKAAGRIDVECARCQFGDGKGKIKVPGHPMLKMGITLPKISLGRVTLRMPIETGRLDFDKVAADSPDLKLQLEGSINLNQRMRFSSIRAYLRLKLSQALLEREKKLSIVDMALGKGKRSDGYYGVLISGVLNKPRVIPQRLGLGTRGRRGTTRGANRRGIGGSRGSRPITPRSGVRSRRITPAGRR